MDLEAPTVPRGLKISEKIRRARRIVTEADIETYFMSQYKALFQTALDELEERFHVDEAIVSLEDVLIRYPGTEDSEVAIRTVGEVFTADVDSEVLRREVKTVRLIKPDRDEWHVQDFVSAFQSDLMLRVILPNIHSCLSLLLVQASTTCTAERAFSVMRRLRTYLRSTCAQARFNHVAICHVHADLLDKIDIQDVVDEWRNSKGISVRQNQVASRVEWDNK